MTKYKITRRNEETECDFCGYALYVDDEVYMSDDERRVYCSGSCARADERNQAPLVKPQPEGKRAGCFDI